MQWEARHYFDRGSVLMQLWGAALLIVACVLWVWLGFLLVDQHDTVCFTVTTHCEMVTAWPKQLTILGISAPLSVFGAALFVAGTVRKQTSTHVLQVIEMQQSEERSRNK
ncbi:MULTISPECIES: hypothetical protein [unclassified Streptomyces]|uniref:hypothetical protein n=1 Tax=unclassified Streptomyces TaxID=2593676 RepID=UPI0036E374F3